MIMDGAVNINKPSGWTSHDVVAKIRGLLKIKKVGHTGTLDPQATGVLPICFGKGTKVVSFLIDVEKEYDVVLRLGQETETQDATGKVIRSCDHIPSHISKSVQSTIESFVGTYVQTPPMYSAVKVRGVPLYKAARDGRVIDRAARLVAIHQIRFHDIEGSDVAFSVVCSKGTYIRTLCADIGSRLGVGGHLLQLRRVRSGRFHIDDAIELDHFCELYLEGNWEKEVYSLNEVLEALPAQWVKESHLQKIKHGTPIGMEGIAKGETFRQGEALRFLDPQGVLLAIGRALVDSDRLLGGREIFFKMETVLSEVEHDPKEPVLSRGPQKASFLGELGDPRK